MSNKFCRALSNGYKIDVATDDLLWSPCCFYSKKTKLLDRDAFKKEIAYTSAANNWLPECRHCKYLESADVDRLKPRLTSFTRVPEDVEDGVCVDLELSFDTNCNAACLTCSGGCSTAWQKYNHKHKLFDYGPITNRAPALLKQLIDTVPMDQLRTLFILGGEPFYSDTHIQLLTHILKVHPDPKKIDLRYQTNGSLFPDEEVRKLWDNFKRVDIGLSLDGVGERFNYLRWPLTWSRVEDTVLKFLTETDVSFTINHTTNPLNLWYFQETVDWANATIPKTRFGWSTQDELVRLNPINYPFGLNLVTPTLRESCLEKYGEDHTVNKVLKRLRYLNNDAEISKMFEYIDLHDGLRKLNWRETFSDIVKYYPNV